MNSPWSLHELVETEEKLWLWIYTHVLVKCDAKIAYW